MVTIIVDRSNIYPKISNKSPTKVVPLGHVVVREVWGCVNKTIFFKVWFQ